jgi:hypothetical protein
MTDKQTPARRGAYLWHVAFVASLLWCLNYLVTVFLYASNAVQVTSMLIWYVVALAVGAWALRATYRHSWGRRD